MASVFFFNDTATTEIYTLSLHDALPISALPVVRGQVGQVPAAAHHGGGVAVHPGPGDHLVRSEEHTSELQSQSNLVCRLLLEKKKHIRGKQRVSGDSKSHSIHPAHDLYT